MLTSLFQLSKPVLRQSLKPAFSRRTVSTPTVSRSLHLSPVLSASYHARPRNGGSMLRDDAPAEVLQSVQRPRPHANKPEDANWARIFAPLMQKALETPGEPERSAEATWKKREDDVVKFLPLPPGPYAGRSVRVKNSDEFTAAYSHLNRILRENNVRRELRLTQRHEKTGVKRRRLRSERWRRRFAHEVRLKVKLVQEIRARGA
ncbi:hypothetical protein NM688_g5861 [Phlebia brevispora]|uniref:Uncharacterized protein n=1 Tax=Phlebia brevispora TaxID=194682 RepID=A0ACC1SNP8_9APHY|nr:hypothetical protein NM688_g5861 [Phlebia brevispora]